MCAILTLSKSISEYLENNTTVLLSRHLAAEGLISKGKCGVHQPTVTKENSQYQWSASPESSLVMYPLSLIHHHTDRSRQVTLD